MEEVMWASALQHRRVCFGAAVALLFPLTLQAAEVKDRYRFCVRIPEDGWMLRGTRPLIDTRGRQTFEEVRYTGKWLSMVTVREFEPNYEFAVEYRFNEAGKLQGMSAMLRRWGQWIAQSKLYPLAGEGFEPFQVKFYNRLGGDVIADPEYAIDPAPRFKAAKVLRTIQEIPCADLLEQAEKSQAEKR